MNGTASFWTRAYQQHISRLIGVCYRYTLDRAVAEDLAHDSFLRAMEKGNFFDGFGNLGNWLTRITVNNTLNYLRDNRLQKHTDHSVDVDDISDPSEEAEPEISADDMLAAIRKAEFTQEEILDAISQIPESHRIVLNLFVFERYSHQQIAELRGISVNTSKSHLLRARKQLQQILFNKSKHKKHTLMLVFPFFTRSEAAIDGYCRQQLSGFELPPAHPMTAEELTAIAGNCPSVPLLWRIPVAPVAAGVTAVTAGAILLIGGHNTNTPASATDPDPAPTTEEVRVAADSVLSANNEAAEWDSCALLPSADVQPAAPQARTHPRPTPSTSETTTLQASDSAAAAVAAPESAKPVVVKKVVRRQQRTVIIQDTSKR